MGRVFWRLFTLQASWTHRRLQGIGTAYASEPTARAAKSTFGDAVYRTRVARAARYFNTNPYFAGLAVGAIARAEHDQVPGPKIDRLRSAIKGPLGLMGDRLIWTGILPLASALSSVVVVLGSPVIGVFVFLVLFNVVQLSVRIWSLPTGWKLGLNLTQAFRNPRLQFALRVTPPLALFALGIAVPVVATTLLGPLGMSAVWVALGTGAAVVFALRWSAPALGAARLGFLALIVALAAGWIWL